MTAQFSDLVFFNDQEFSLTDINGDELFHPMKYDLVPSSTCTACWKGFVASYGIKEDQLVLKNLDINIEEVEKKYFWSSNIPELNGMKPSKDDSLYDMFDYHFQDVKLPLSFTGWMLIGKGFIQELYVHMGIHPAWKYKDVFKLDFEKGKLLASHDVSVAMREYRKTMQNEGGEPVSFPEGKEPDQWIENYLNNL